MRLLQSILVGATAMVALWSAPSFAADTVRLAVLKFGTVNWELSTIQRNELDKQNHFEMSVLPLASGQAAKVALQAGEVDMIVSDWLWVSRQRASGKRYTFVPFSASLGALMVPAESDISSLADLKGKKIAVAGGPLDKSWLLLRGVDPEETARLQKLSSLLREAVAERKDMVGVDTSPLRDRLAKKPTLYSCNGCETKLAAELGAERSVSGFVYKVSTLILYITVSVRDTASGKIIEQGNVSIRGNTDESWRHGLQSLLKRQIFMIGQE